VRRGTAALSAAALGVAAVALGAVALAAGGGAAQAPDPFVADGDPCCAHPDTWGQVAAGAVGAIALAAVAGGMLAGAVALGFRAAGRELPRWSRMVAIPLATLGLATLAFAVAIVPKLGDARRLPSCDTFRFSEADWRAGGDRQKAAAWGIAKCGTFDGASRAYVQARLGRPKVGGALSGGDYIGYDGLALVFADDRVVNADAGY